MPLGGYQGQRIEVYLPSKAMKASIDEAAKARGITVTKYVRSLIDADLSKGQKKVPKLLKEVERMKERIIDLERELAEAQARRDQYKAALDRENALAFPEGNEANYSAALIQVLKDHGPIQENSLLAALQVDPKDIVLHRAIGLQLEALEGYGLIRKGPRGWRWIG
jgi:seryl-tRNA synthetase